MLKKIHIRNFKSIYDEEIELGAFNVFIGQNGCGKTNVLEAVGMVAAAMSGRLTTEDLFIRGIRVARPSLMASGFLEGEPTPELVFEGERESVPYGFDTGFRFHLEPRDARSHGGAWAEVGADPAEFPVHLYTYEDLYSYAIFSPSTNTLRGLETSSRREPLGLYGENLDVALASFDEPTLQRLKDLVRLIDWVDDIQVDPSDALKFAGLKLGRSVSRLYFTDKYMREDNRTFSAENANEGVLHVLFHLALFLSTETPGIFAIDNLETALNPGMCRRLTKVLAELAAERNKQALVTTHNPAILDGLNLHDDTQRLFVVYRNDDGHTKVKRVKMKPDAAPGLKLSELWLRGHLGALPQDF